MLQKYDLPRIKGTGSLGGPPSNLQDVARGEKEQQSQDWAAAPKTCQNAQFLYVFVQLPALKPKPLWIKTLRIPAPVELSTCRAHSVRPP